MLIRKPKDAAVTTNLHRLVSLGGSWVARLLLRDGNKVGAEVSPEGLEVITYEDQKGQLIHALATVKAERESLRQVPSKLLPLYVRKEQAPARAVGRN